MTKEEKISLIVEKINQCEKCPELCASRIQTVPGTGNVNADIVIIGEAPGRTESERGIPFCGRSGELLTNILAACNIKREEIFITNTCKCRPPNNRTPLPDEVENCRPFLNLQLKAINPRYIICMGSCASQNLLGVTTPIGAMRGQWFDYQNIKVMATWHPAYALRNKSAKQEIYEDVMLVKKMT
jgi:DNA polymerase